MCPGYGTRGHPVQERTVLVGYSCQRHSNHAREKSLWSSGSEKPRSQILYTKTSGEIRVAHKITSETALKALEDAQLMEDDETSTQRLDESIMETASTQTTVDNELRHEVKQHSISNHAANLDDLRSRLLSPSQYVASMQELRKKELRKTGHGIEDYIPYPLVPPELQDVLPNRLSDDPFAKDPTNTSDEEITALCQSTADLTISSHLNAIRMCRNVVLRTFLNLKLLQQANFCAGCFSLMVLDVKRPDVAILLPIENTDFVAFIYEIEYILRDSASMVLNTSESNTPLNIDRQSSFLRTPMVKKYCLSLLQMSFDYILGLNSGVVNVLRNLVLTLDLAIISYAGAHCSDLLSDALASDGAIVLLAPFAQYQNQLNQLSVHFQRCHLHCLDAFHGRGVWVFCPPRCLPSLPLYLSADIEGFSDIWGPLWKLKDSDNPEKYAAYIVGSGSIVQWHHDPQKCPKLIEERFCHWIRTDDVEDGTHDHPDQGTSLEYISFDGTEKLLIGAPVSTPATMFPQVWTVNTQCSTPISEARTRLREAGRLCIVGASKPYHYNDSNQYQIQFGYSGVNASATRQYKRVPGQSLKEILIELWAMEPEIRDPGLLEDLHGIEISMCTYNAQRVPLTQILRLNCMHHLLREFKWLDPEYRTEHFLTLEDTLRPKRLHDSQFKEKFDHAVMLGLKMLSKTGVDSEDNLRVFLSSTCTPKPELATMLSKVHTWIGLLKDTTTECAMAAFGDACLGFQYKEGATCGKVGPSALLSAIIPHSSMFVSSNQVRPSDDRKRSSQTQLQELDTSALVTGKTFSLGERGKLRLKSNLGGGALVIEWSSHSMKLAFKGKLGREPVHREYTEIDHSGHGNVARPVPIIVVSDRP